MSSGIDAITTPALRDDVELFGGAAPTSGGERVRWLIDHVAVSDHFALVGVDSWNNVVDGHRLTDHSGAVVELELRPT